MYAFELGSPAFALISSPLVLRCDCSSFGQSALYSKTNRSFRERSGYYLMEAEEIENQQKLLTTEYTPTSSIHEAHQNSIETLAAKRHELATGSHDHLIKTWDLPTCKLKLTLSGHKEGVWSVDYSPDGDQLLSGSCDSTLVIWDLKTGKQAQTLSAHKNKVYWAKYNETGELVASGGQNSPTLIYDLKTNTVLKELPVKSEVTYCVAWSKDGKYLATTEMDGTLNLYDSKTFALLATAPGSAVSDVRAYGCDLDFSELPGRIFVATQDKHIKEFSFEDKALHLAKEHFAHYDAVKSLALNGHKQLLVSTGHDGSVRLWNAKKGLKMVANLVGHQENVSKAVFVPSKDVVVASASWDQNVNIWKLKL